MRLGDRFNKAWYRLRCAVGWHNWTSRIVDKIAGRPSGTWEKHVGVRACNKCSLHQDISKTGAVVASYFKAYRSSH